MSRAFVFGKLPAHGDFVQRGLGDAARDAWDAACAAMLERARTDLGEDFEDAHDQAPPWRFVCGPSSLGADWRAGALAPSVDSAGRRFLLVLGVDGLSSDEAQAIGQDAATACEAAIYQVFAAGLDADGAFAAVRGLAEGLSAGEARDTEPRSLWWTLDAEGARADQIASAELPSDLLLRTFTTVTPLERVQ